MYDVAYAAGELADAIAEGSLPDASQIAQAGRNVARLADEARALVNELGRPRGRPPKAALDAAEALKARGLSWPQIATVLDIRSLRLNPHTSENIRKSVLARRRMTPPLKNSRAVRHFLAAQRRAAESVDLAV